MSWESQFQEQWVTLVDSVETHARRALAGRPLLDVAALDEILQREVAKWNRPSHYNGAWLAKLAGTHPEVAARFRATLGNLRAVRPLVPQIGNPWLRVALVVALVAAAFFIAWWQTDRLLVHVAAPLTAGIVFGSLVRARWQAARELAIDRAVGAFLADLDGVGRQLREAAAEADRMDDPEDRRLRA
ncbi:MAG: hypothetical protein DIU58_009160 [Sphaerobacter thermophilus]|uniref:Uncharacterized protein n=2 Tax=Sphaerobacter TaxID=2056 RepID=D1C4W7_SPHTD|nr:hypothetical protein [Sphaerobacter thermophilus]ACZ39284.1 hypothetical protein Sthe_1851 [Sphaerobacter thermophilus DSM 20745]PZN61274.1 MAG: hypothetical protein DIU58_14280 [Sphaerobacter thermophilus]